MNKYFYFFAAVFLVNNARAMECTLVRKFKSINQDQLEEVRNSIKDKAVAIDHKNKTVHETSEDSPRSCIIEASSICRNSYKPYIVESVDILLDKKFKKNIECASLNKVVIEKPEEPKLKSLQAMQGDLSYMLQKSCGIDADQAKESASKENVERTFLDCTPGTIVSIKGCQVSCLAEKSSPDPALKRKLNIEAAAAGKR